MSRRMAASAAAVLLITAGLPVLATQAATRFPASATPMRGNTTTAVPLITGDQVTVAGTPGGPSSYTVRPAAGSKGAAISYQTPSGEHYIIPAAAMPYVGHGLDQSLFDVTALARDGITAGARVPVSLTFTGATPAAPAGVTLTSVKGETAQGYLTAGSGRSFAAALRKLIGADVAAHRPAATTPLPSGLATMKLAAPGAPAQVKPAYPMHILQLNVTDLAGQPANTVVGLMNNDDPSREYGLVGVVDGVARIEVPAGDYSVNAGFLDWDSQGNNTAMREVEINDLTVPGTSGVTTTAVSESSATSAVSATTPRPSTEDLLLLTWYRIAANGVAAASEALSWGGPTVPTYVNAQPKATVGRLRYVAQWGGAGPVTGGAYRYDAGFGSDDVPADEAFVVRADQVATVREHFSADPAVTSGSGTLLNGVVDPAYAGVAQGAVAALAGVVTPGNLTDYLGTADGGTWVQSAGLSALLQIDGDPHTFAARHRYSVQWAHGPLAAGFGRHTGPQDCQACVAGGTLSLAFNLVGDSQPDHVALPPYGFGQQPSVHLTLYRDGVKLYDADGNPGAVVPNIPATPSTLRAVLDADFTAVPGFSQSSRTHTDVTVPYTPAVPAGSLLPTGDTCAGQSATAPCGILPALRVGYRLATDERNTSSAPTQVMHLNVGHLGYDGAGSTAKIASATLSVSFDGGVTWQPATMTGSGPHYTASWPNPASARGTDPEIRVTAADALGGSFTQTVTNAYTIAPAAPNGSSR